MMLRNQRRQSQRTNQNHRPKTLIENVSMDSSKKRGTMDGNWRMYGYWSVISIVVGSCIVTMLLVPLLAFIAGGYLTTTSQYVVGITIVVIGAVLGMLMARRRKTDKETPEQLETGSIHEDR
jgi:hypothetical protein